MVLKNLMLPGVQYFIIKFPINVCRCKRKKKSVHAFGQRKKKIHLFFRKFICSLWILWLIVNLLFFPFLLEWKGCHLLKDLWKINIIIHYLSPLLSAFQYLLLLAFTIYQSLILGTSAIHFPQDVIEIVNKCHSIMGQTRRSLSDLEVGSKVIITAECCEVSSLHP